MTHYRCMLIGAPDLTRAFAFDSDTDAEPAWQRRGICHLCRCAATPCPERWEDEPHDIAHSGDRAALAELAPLCACRDGRPVRRRTVRPYRAGDPGRGTLARPARAGS